MSVITVTSHKEREAAFSSVMHVPGNVSCDTQLLPGKVQQSQLSCLSLALTVPQVGQQELAAGLPLYSRKAERLPASWRGVWLLS